MKLDFRAKRPVGFQRGFVVRSYHEGAHHETAEDTAEDALAFAKRVSGRAFARFDVPVDDEADSHAMLLVPINEDGTVPALLEAVSLG